MPQSFTVTIELSDTELWTLGRIIDEVQSSPQMPLAPWSVEQELKAMIRHQLWLQARLQGALDNVAALRRAEAQQVQQVQAQQVQQQSMPAWLD